jgi:hypothetical protein
LKGYSTKALSRGSESAANYSDTNVALEQHIIFKNDFLTVKRSSCSTTVCNCRLQSRDAYTRMSKAQRYIDIMLHFPTTRTPDVHMENIITSQGMVCTTSLVGPPALLDDSAQLLKLALRTKQSPELQRKNASAKHHRQTHSFDREHTRFLVSFRAFLSCNLRMRDKGRHGHLRIHALHAPLSFSTTP